jgi:hypothetical protein
MAENAMTGLIVAGLDCLADHYWPEREHRRVTLAAAMAADDFREFGPAILARAQISGLPPERIGRAA